jgi:hypothetical protein
VAELPAHVRGVFGVDAIAHIVQVRPLFCGAIIRCRCRHAATVANIRGAAVASPSAVIRSGAGAGLRMGTPVTIVRAAARGRARPAVGFCACAAGGRAPTARDTAPRTRGTRAIADTVAVRDRGSPAVAVAVGVARAAAPRVTFVAGAAATVNGARDAAAATCRRPSQKCGSGVSKAQRVMSPALLCVLICR